MTPAPALQPSDGFRDITKEFFELSESARSSSLILGWLADGCGWAELEVGELVQEPYFTLLQAVGALEVWAWGERWAQS